MTDILGLKVWGETAKLITTSGIQLTQSFLEILAKPAIEELGFIFKDRVTVRRLNNIVATLEKSQGRFVYEDNQLKINPKILGAIIEGASNEDDEFIQTYWAGLLISASNDSTNSNLIYTNILKSITALQAKMIDYSCEKSNKVLLDSGEIDFGPVNIMREQCKDILGTDDLDLLWLEIDHLASLGLQFIPTTFDGGGVIKDSNFITIYPSALAANLYVRGHGKNSVRVFFNHEIITQSEFIKKSAAVNFERYKEDHKQ